MATFYIQLEDRLLQISGELTAENISKALGYVPVDSSTMSNYATKDEVSNLVDMSMVEELSQRVDNITFDSLKDNPFLQDGSGELNIVDEAGNLIAKIDAEGIHSVDFIAGNHKLTDKIDSTALNGYAKESWVTAEITKAATEGKVDLTGYATEEWVENKNYLTEHQDISHLATKDEVSDLVDMSVVNELQGKVNTLIDTDADKSVRDIAVDVLTKTLVSETATEAYDTLAEMSAWIKSHPEDVAAMNTAIQKNATDIQSNATAITNLDAAYKAADANVLTNAQEYTNNINFYTIKNNPIVDDEAGSITFVDETGYIGLKFTEDGIITKDVITPEHMLSSKADKSFVEDNYYNKSTVDKKITEAVTGGQVSLDGFATEQWVNEQGFLKNHQDISHLAEKSELPTKTSDLTNDSGFITINEVPEVTVPTKVSELENDSKFITIDEVPEVTVPTKTSELTNDSGFITINDVPVLEIPEEYVTETELNDKGFLTEHQDISHLASKIWVESQGYAKAEDIPSLDEYAKTSDIPSLNGLVKTEDLPNFDEFAKTEDIPSLDDYASKEWVNNKNYATEYELKTIDYSSINNVPITDDNSGELNIADENGNVVMKISSEAVYSNDFIADSHKLSDKQDKLVSGTNIKTINGESIIGEGDIIISAGSESTSVDWENIQNKPQVVTIDSETFTTSDIYNIQRGHVTYKFTPGRLIIDDLTGDDSCSIKGHGDLTFNCNGDGTTFLADDGTYKEVYNKNEIDAKIKTLEDSLEAALNRIAQLESQIENTLDIS